MTGLIPALVAVLLAEFGPRALSYAEADRPRAAAALIVLCVTASAIAGQLVAPMLTEWADALMIGIALAFAALAQAQGVRRVRGLLPLVVLFWRGGVPLLAFALAARFGALPVVPGTLAGLVAAAIATRAVRSARLPDVLLRWCCVAALAVAGFVVAVQGLRLT